MATKWDRKVNAWITPSVPVNAVIPTTDDAVDFSRTCRSADQISWSSGFHFFEGTKQEEGKERAFIRRRGLFVTFAESSDRLDPTPCPAILAPCPVSSSLPIIFLLATNDGTLNTRKRRYQCSNSKLCFPRNDFLFYLWPYHGCKG